MILTNDPFGYGYDPGMGGFFKKITRSVKKVVSAPVKAVASVAKPMRRVARPVLRTVGGAATTVVDKIGDIVKVAATPIRAVKDPILSATVPTPIRRFASRAWKNPIVKAVGTTAATFGAGAVLAPVLTAAQAAQAANAYNVYKGIETVSSVDKAVQAAQDASNARKAYDAAVAANAAETAKVQAEITALKAEQARLATQPTTTQPGISQSYAGQSTTPDTSPITPAATAGGLDVDALKPYLIPAAVIAGLYFLGKKK